MKLKYKGQADAPVTFQGKFQVETGDVVEADELDANALLQTGKFEVVDEDTPNSAEADTAGKGSKKSSDDDTSSTNSSSKK